MIREALLFICSIQVALWTNNGSTFIEVYLIRFCFLEKVSQPWNATNYNALHCICKLRYSFCNVRVLKQD